MSWRILKIEQFSSMDKKQRSEALFNLVRTECGNIKKGSSRKAGSVQNATANKTSLNSLFMPFLLSSFSSGSLERDLISAKRN